MRCRLILTGSVGLSTRSEHDHTRRRYASAAGGFLTQTLRASDLFTREELTEEQQLFGRTAAEFMHNEVLPREQRALCARLGADATSCCRRRRRST